LVVDTKRIFVGILILLFFTFSYFFKLDYLILFIISMFAIFDLFKSKFISGIYDLIFSIIFLIFAFLIGINYDFIDFSNIILITLVFIILLKPNFYQRLLFLFIILLFLNNFFSVFHNDRDLLFFIIFVSFFNDTIAYLCGNIIKGPLIIPSISPKKTWSGTILSFVITANLIFFFEYPLFISILLSLSLFFGDIFFSYIKRINNLKDFSNILKGHGGILDRLDSMFFFIIIINYYQ
tara:strand:- start:4599 stop:5309 length:711 start_codon:yes stop_codon:yes gene_type:complete